MNVYLDNEQILALFVILATSIFYIRLSILDDKARRDYSDGWNDCHYLMTRKFEDNEPEEEVLKYMKKALTSILRDGDKYIRGDIKAINECRDVQELKDKVREILER